MEHASYMLRQNNRLLEVFLSVAYIEFLVASGENTLV